MSREKRTSLARETMEILSSGRYIAPSGHLVEIASDLAEAKAASRLYRPDDFPAHIEAIGDRTVSVEVTSESTLEAARRVAEEIDSNPLCLNYASARNPGGGFLSGSQAQEESLARSSGLYPCIAQMTEMYEHNRRLATCLYSDYMVYSPAVPVFRQDDGRLLENPYKAAFITAPAVNARAVRANERDRVNLLRPTMQARLNRLLWVAAEHQHLTLILGAWGCGVFDNDPQMVATLFAHALSEGGPFSGYFKHIVFAVFDRSKDQKDLKAFRQCFEASR